MMKRVLPAYREFDSGAARYPHVLWWVVVAAGAILLLSFPSFSGLATQLSLSGAFILALLALSMGFLWGYVGILSFGQTVFFGIGGYVYAVFTMNTGLPVAGVVVGIMVAMAFAVVLGYFMIYGRISEIYLSIMTLVVTLIFAEGMRATSGPQFVIGSVRLGGQNGIPGVPGIALNIGALNLQSIVGIFYLSAVCLIVVYVGVRLLLARPLGRIFVGIRENSRRMELLGFDSRLYKLVAFVLAGGIAGLAGVLFVLWGRFVGPSMFGLNQAALVVIWVIVGGKAVLIGPIAGAIAIRYLTSWLGTVGVGQVTLVLGAVLVGCVLVFPKGLIPALRLAVDRIGCRMFRRPPP